MSRSSIVAACAALLLSSGLAYAQDPIAPSPSEEGAGPGDVIEDDQQLPPPPASRPFLRAWFHADFTTLAASRTFDTVIGTSQISMRGGGGEVLNLWKGLFARVAFSAARETGSRVIVIDDEVIPIGIPLTVEFKPLEFGGGWRFRPMGGGRIVPYVGAGVLRVGYRETSDFAQSGDNTDTTFNGSVVFGGVEASVFSWIIAGVEAQYRTIPDAIGGGGVSGAFGETDLGGTTIRVLIGIRR